MPDSNESQLAFPGRGMVIRLEDNEWSVLDVEGRPLAVLWQAREGDAPVWRAGPANGARGQGVENPDFRRVIDHCFKTMHRAH